MFIGDLLQKGDPGHSNAKCIPVVWVRREGAFQAQGPGFKTPCTGTGKMTLLLRCGSCTTRNHSQARAWGLKNTQRHEPLLK